MNIPAISVIMPVHNMELFVLSAVDSILKQSLSDFEFIIIDDHSIDDTKSILDEITDSRIIRINNQNHTGNYQCRNQGLDMAKGKYVCVMDADDISLPNRLLTQYNFMESNPQYMAAGSDIEFFSTDSSPRLFQRLRDPEQIKVNLLKSNVCTHPSLIIRKKAFDDYNLRYSDEYFYSADYDLMLSISRIGSITNIPVPLLQYRIHEKQISTWKKQEQLVYGDQIRLKQLSFFNLRPSVDDVMIHLCLMNEFPISKLRLPLAEKWCNKLLKQNTKLKIYNQEFLFEFLAQHLELAICNSF